MTLFLMNSGQARARLVQAGAVFVAAALVAGCGSTYRPVVTPIGSSGPPAQPIGAYAVVVSAPSPTTAGIATVIDYSGDTVLAYAPIGPGPSVFTLTESGTTGYTVNSDGTLSNIPISSQLQAKQITYSTLSSASQPAPPHPPVNMFSSVNGLWGADLTGNYADVFTGSPVAFHLAIPVATTPVMIAGPPSTGQRNYAISQDFDDFISGSSPNGVACNISPTTAPVNGEADGIEISSLTLSSQIPVGLCPVYAVQSPDNRRLFVLNRGSGTVTVINSQDNTPDSCTPFQNQNGHWITCHPSIALPAGPVYAEFSAATQQLVVANYDSNTISIIDVSLDDFGNDFNTYENNDCTTYAACGAITGGFGTVYTVPVGNNPASVTVLNDGSRAYTANQTDGTVTIVNLTSHTVEKTLPVIGHPRTVVSTQNSQFGKVYVASPDSPYITILRTDLDIVDTTILVEGNVVDVRVTSPNASGGSSNQTSRSPGHGQPCNLPLSDFAPTTSISLTLSNCQVQDVTLLQ